MQTPKPQDAQAEIERVLGLYFDALYYCDIILFGEVFHPKAQYVCATNGNFVYHTMDEYFAIIKTREPPSARNEARRDKIICIEIAGENLARAKVNCAIANKFFTDYLTLIYTQNRWQIISKAFHFELI